ncbi:MAG: HAD family hydrolase [Thermodesulfobacteriota bacterium]
MDQELQKPIIVLDVGSVLVEVDPDRALRRLEKRSGKQVGMPSSQDLEEMFVSLYVGDRSWLETVETINRQLGISLNKDEWREIWCSIITGEVPGMGQALAELKDEFALIALSNTDEVHWNYVLATYPVMQRLDGWVVSFEEGAKKPDTAIYQRFMDRYGNGELPFFYTDDNAQFVDAANKLGWDAEVFVDASHFKQQIARRRKNNVNC